MPVTLESLSENLPPGSGPVALLSGDEFLPPVAPFDEELIARAGRRIALVLCADHRAAPQSAAFARRHFASLGAEVVSADLVHGDWEPAGVLPDFDVAYLAGGSPPDLLRCLRGSSFWGAMLDRWRAGKALAGSSAGAMALASDSLVPEPGARVPTRWERGVGPLTGVGLAVHATSRPRAWLDEVARGAPVPVLALDDRTGVIVAAGSAPRVVGEGDVWFVNENTSASDDHARE